MKKLAWLLALVMCLSSACAFAEGIAVSGDGEFPIVEDKVDLTVWCYQRATVEDLWTNDQTVWYEDKTNVHVNWVIVPQEEVTTKLNLSLASGEYPDIYFTNLSPAQVTSMASTGVIIPLNDLIEKYGYYTKMAIEANPEYAGYATTSDGNIYTLWHDDIGAHNLAQEKMFVLADWYNAYVEATGAEVVTTEDFRNMLIYFRDNDMNGNGDPSDEIPFISSTNGWNSSPLWYLMCPFQLVAGSSTMLNVTENGEIKAPYITDGWREGLKYIHSLYADGLIAEESFVQDNSQLMALVSKADPSERIVGTTSACWQGSFTDQSIINNYEYLCLDPLEGPDGTRQTAVRGNSFGLGGAITSACEHPEIAMKWLDYWMSLEGSFLNTKGWEGINYEWHDNEISMLGTYPGLFELTTGATGDKQNNFWYETSVFRDSAERRYAIVGEPNSPAQLLYSNASRYINEFGVKTNWPVITWGSEDQVNQISMLEPTITDYVKSTAVQFILGGLDIENDGEWENYLTELNSMGLEEYLAIQTEIINGDK